MSAGVSAAGRPSVADFSGAPAAAPICPGCQAPRPDPVGKPGEPVRAFAFAGGGFDTAMQLGVTHALVVSESLAPDLAVGISVGAINAAVLAETLQAPDRLEPARRNDQDARRQARMSRFREFLYAYQEAPGMLLTGFLPDTYEADAGKALEPNQQAIHFSAERGERRKAMQTRTGLVHLLNDVASLGLSVGAVARLARAALGMKAAGEEQRELRYWRLYAVELARLVRTVLLNLGGVVQVFWMVVSAVVRGKGEGGFSAGQIIFRWDGVRRFFGALFFVVSFPLALVCLAGIAFLGLLLHIWNRIRLRAHKFLGRQPPPRGGPNSLLTRFGNRILNRYDLLQDLGNPHLVRDLLVRLFDPNYYGLLDMDRIVEKALRPDGREKEESRPAPPHRTFREYAEASCPIHVSPIVADLREGELRALRSSYGVVDGLLAAISVTPWLPVVPSTEGDNYFLDGINIANEPTKALMGLLRERLHPGTTEAYIYSVAPFPVELDVLPGDRTVYSGLVDVVLRSKKLQAFRSAKLERSLARLYTRLLDSTGAGGARALRCIDGDHYIHSELTPIEAERPLNLNERLFTAENAQEQQEAIAEAVAQGCRATLQAILPRQLAAQPGGRATVPCAAVLSARLGRVLPALPGAKEVCAACCIGKGEGDLSPATQALARRPDVSSHADWPLESGAAPESAPVAIPSAAAPLSAPSTLSAAAGPEPGERKSQVALLFSGGVFRGVFQMGVVNALSELGMQPDVIAGSSVGSITAAMIATVFSLPEGERSGRIARLAATYLALDHLIVTDRFADFVRRLTLRAAETKMTPRDLDAFFRRYDERAFEGFSGSARRVVAGFDQLFHMSPFALKELVQALRQRRGPLASRLLKAAVQEFLDRGGVGLEVLGTEPLSLLIEQHVLFGEASRGVRPRAVPFQKFRDSVPSIEFLATATNLTAGQLDIIGLPDRTDRERGAILMEALLASSAFPGVFRPRWGWEIYPDSGGDSSPGGGVVSQYVDGGIMDNLPLEAVITYLHKKAAAGEIIRRPLRAPHLIFTASLESNYPLLEPAELRRIAGSWPEISKRASQLQYNKKIDSFQTSQRELRRIYDHRTSPPPNDWVPLNIEVVVAKPEWLCETFGFHPMLGFRRDKQAASIAHGCASTLATFYRVSRARDEEEGAYGLRWTAFWGASPRVTGDMEEKSVGMGFITPQTKTDGVTCHFRRNASCPFSEARVRALNLPESTVASLATIYRECGYAQNHRRPGDSGQKGASGQRPPKAAPRLNVLVKKPGTPSQGMP